MSLQNHGSVVRTQKDQGTQNCSRKGAEDGAARSVSLRIDAMSCVTNWLFKNSWREEKELAVIELMSNLSYLQSSKELTRGFFKPYKI